MQISPTTKQPAFSAKFQFVPKHVIEAARPPIYSEKYISGLYMCNAVAITGGTSPNNFYSHIYPFLFIKNLAGNLAETKKSVYNAISSIQKEGITPSAMIFGGEAHHQQSFCVASMIKNIIESFKIKPTVVWGSHNVDRFNPTEKAALYNPKEDRWLLNVNGNFIDFTQKDHVKRIMSHMEVAPNDEIKFADTAWIKGGSPEVTQKTDFDDMNTCLQNVWYI